MPSDIHHSELRRIIDDYAIELNQYKRTPARPSKIIINFRNDVIERKERNILQVPITLLRYRKDNGRIASDVLDYEQQEGPIDEATAEGQELLRDFLEKKDPERTQILKKNIMHSGQREPAIITCDGFLINGNRRKMVFEALSSVHREGDKFQYMKVVILPGPDDDEPPPTLLEIEKLENRYQLQSEGKSEYYGFDRALSIQRKIRVGLSLEDQLADDPQFTGATRDQIEKAKKDIYKNYLNPLKCVERYLKQCGREKQYHAVSGGKGDSHGRWQAFIDYSNTLETKLKNERVRAEYGIEEDEIGEIEEAAFDIIRLRSVPDMPKVHVLMRNLHKYCSTPEGKKEIVQIANKVEPILPEREHFRDDKLTEPKTRSEVEAIWAEQNKQEITFHLKRAAKYYENRKEKETPLGLLEAAYKKLTHSDMDLTQILTSDYDTARSLLSEIQKVAKDMEHQIYSQKKKLGKLARKGK